MGTLNNGSHAVNAITALFIATGRNVATVAEASVAINDARITPVGDDDNSVTLPSLIVTHTTAGRASRPRASAWR